MLRSRCRSISTIRNKKSHKQSIDRDLLIVELYLKTGMRWNQLAGLKVRDVHRDFIMVIKGKGGKDRMIPLLPDIAGRLNNYTRDRQHDESILCSWSTRRLGGIPILTKQPIISHPGNIDSSKDVRPYPDSTPPCTK